MRSSKFNKRLKFSNENLNKFLGQVAAVIMKENKSPNQAFTSDIINIFFQV